MLIEAVRIQPYDVLHFVRGNWCPNLTWDKFLDGFWCLWPVSDW